ncbi:GNAT family N-acetyltransferase [Altericroceibacterium xinjiangense]|uniref:GNAT family N-acetyltransferase n=1 Tax=Altericroceibacterium xinjiangense TaxID=762261 RepID=UPI000F7E7806|nr:GNAT family N-acetyltransferase [Altericroceibacterium xinjiangense]
MRIDPATEVDLEAIDRLVQRAYRGDAARAGWTHEADLLDGQRTDPEMLREGLANPRLRRLVARDGAELIGCAEVTSPHDGLAAIGLLTVDPARQGQGLAKQLLGAAERLAADEFAARRIELTVIRQRSELIAYYERRGYLRTGEERPFPHHDPRFGVPRRNDLAFVVLGKNLPDAD